MSAEKPLALNPISTALMIAGACLCVRKNNVVFEGEPVPRKGAAILAGNHFRDGDSYKSFYLATTLGRVFRAVVRESLIARDAQESPEYLASIGNKTDNLNEYSPFKAFVLRGIGVIGIRRDNPDTKFLLSQCKAVLEAEKVVALFMQPTRNEECSLKNLQVGAALLAMRHPNVPVYPVAFSGPPDSEDRMFVCKPFTYAQRAQEYREEHGQRLSAAGLTIMLVDAITKALPQKIQTNWLERTRAAEVARLVGSGR